MIFQTLPSLRPCAGSGGKSRMPLALFADFSLILIGDGKPVASSLGFSRHARQARKRAARRVGIEPRRSGTGLRNLGRSPVLCNCGMDVRRTQASPAAW